MRLLYWLLAGPLMLLVALFAISNLNAIDIGLWPLPFTVKVPIYLVALSGLGVGFLAGGLVAWFSGGRARARARAAERAVRRRDREIEELRRRADNAERESMSARAAQPQTANLPAPVGVDGPAR